MAEWYFDKDADLSVIVDKTIAVIGFGNQGRSQALNMRDSGLTVIVGSRNDESAATAKDDGFEVFEPEEAVRRAQIIFLLVPDEVMPAIYKSTVEPGLDDGDLLIFASGYNIYFRHIEPPGSVDVGMIAPRMIGQGVRDHFLNGESFPSLIAVNQDASGQGLAKTLALCKGIGSTKMGVFMSSFEEETIVDLFAEQVGGLYAIRRFFEALTAAGCSPEAVLLELYASGEGIATATAYRDKGLWAQLPLHSRTSQYGQEVTSKLPAQAEQAELNRLGGIIENIRNGTFAEAWRTEQDTGCREFDRTRAENLAHKMVSEERKLYKLLGRIPEAPPSAD